MMLFILSLLLLSISSTLIYLQWYFFSFLPFHRNIRPFFPFRLSCIGQTERPTRHWNHFGLASVRGQQVAAAAAASNGQTTRRRTKRRFVNDRSSRRCENDVDACRHRRGQKKFVSPLSFGFLLEGNSFEIEGIGLSCRSRVFSSVVVIGCGGGKVVRFVDLSLNNPCSNLTFVGRKL